MCQIKWKCFRFYCWLNVLCISNPVLVSIRDLREALSAAELWSLPFRGSVVEVASKLLSLGFHTGDPITIQLGSESNFANFPIVFLTSHNVHLLCFQRSKIAFFIPNYTLDLPFCKLWLFFFYLGIVIRRNIPMT